MLFVSFGLASAFALICLVPVRVFVFLCLGGGSDSFARRSNPSRDTGSKRLRNQDEAPEGSNASQRRTKHTATKQRDPTMGMDEIPLSEFIVRALLGREAEDKDEEVVLHADPWAV